MSEEKPEQPRYYMLTNGAIIKAFKSDENSDSKLSSVAMKFTAAFILTPPVAASHTGKLHYDIVDNLIINYDSIVASWD